MRGKKISVINTEKLLYHVTTKLPLPDETALNKMSLPAPTDTQRAQLQNLEAVSSNVYLKNKIHPKHNNINHENKHDKNYQEVR